MPVRTLSFVPGTSLLLSGSDDKKINLYDTTVSPQPFRVTRVTMCPGPPGRAFLNWDLLYSLAYSFLQNASKVASMLGHDSWVLSVAHNPYQEQFASASSDKSVKIWDIRNRACVHTFSELHRDQVWDVAYKPDGTQLVSVSDDCSIIVYDVA
jgi:WD repeat-containing protein 61